MTHTPGPWELHGHDPITVAHSKYGVISHIAMLHDLWIRKEHGGRALANAELIAAAPDLLEALESLLEAFTTETDVSTLRDLPIIEAARAAIAKAKGQP